MLYNKLIRDNIPKIFEKSGYITTTKVLNDKNYEDKLIETLKEKVEILSVKFESKDDESVIMEIAELTVLLQAFLQLIGISEESFDKIVDNNLNKYGGYRNKLLLIETVEKK